LASHDRRQSRDGARVNAAKVRTEAGGGGVSFGVLYAAYATYIAIDDDMDDAGDGGRSNAMRYNNTRDYCATS